MKKLFARTLAGLLALLMLGGCVACGGGGDPTQTQAGTSLLPIHPHRKGATRMKKAVLVLLLTALTLTVTACMTLPVGTDLPKDSGEPVAVELYYAEQTYYEGDIHLLREELTPCYVAEGEAAGPLLETLSGLSYGKGVVLLPIPMDGGYDYGGYLAAVVYADGSYAILAEGGQYTYTLREGGNGAHGYEYADYRGDTPWEQLFKEYVPAPAETAGNAG